MLYGVSFSDKKNAMKCEAINLDFRVCSSINIKRKMVEPAGQK